MNRVTSQFVEADRCLQRANHHLEQVWKYERNTGHLLDESWPQFAYMNIVEARTMLKRAIQIDPQLRRSRYIYNQLGKLADSRDMYLTEYKVRTDYGVTVEQACQVTVADWEMCGGHCLYDLEYC